MIEKPCKEHPHFTIAILSVFGYLWIWMAIFGHFNRSFDNNLNIVLLIVAIFVFIAYKKKLKNLEKKFCEKEIDKKSYIVMVLALVLLVIFLSYIGCASEMPMFLGIQ